MSSDVGTVKSLINNVSSERPEHGTIKIDELEKSRVEELRAIGLRARSGDLLNYIAFNVWQNNPWVIKADAGYLLWTLRNMVLTYYDFGQITLDYDQDCTIMFPVLSPPSNELHADGKDPNGVHVVPWDTGTATADGSSSSRHIHIGPVPYDVRQYNNLVSAELNLWGGYWRHA